MAVVAVVALAGGVVVAAVAAVAVSAAMDSVAAGGSVGWRVRMTNTKMATAIAARANRSSPATPPTSARERSGGGAGGATLGAGGSPQTGGT